jgi:hypothetical protein
MDSAEERLRRLVAETRRRREADRPNARMYADAMRYDTDIDMPGVNAGEGRNNYIQKMPATGDEDIRVKTMPYRKSDQKPGPYIKKL